MLVDLLRYAFPAENGLVPTSPNHLATAHQTSLRQSLPSRLNVILKSAAVDPSG